MSNPIRNKDAGIPGNGGQFAGSQPHAESDVSLSKANPGVDAINQAMAEFKRDNPTKLMAHNDELVMARAADIQTSWDMGIEDAPAPVWNAQGPDRSPEAQAFVDAGAGRSTAALASYLHGQANPIDLDRDATSRASTQAVSAWLATQDRNLFDEPGGDSRKTIVARALIENGIRPEKNLVNAIHSRLRTDDFEDEDGEHDAQNWAAFDADERYRGRFTEYVGGRAGFRMSVTPGDSDSFQNDGFSWRAEMDNWHYSGVADTAEEAQRHAVSHADYVISGKAEADHWNDYDNSGDNFDPTRD
jgi:hypothetical protein